jgi:hypothetical protein
MPRRLPQLEFPLTRGDGHESFRGVFSMNRQSSFRLYPPATMFHFNCAFCGAHPPERLLVNIVGQWRKAPQSDFDALIERYAAVLAAIRQPSTVRRTKKFMAALEKLYSQVTELRRSLEMNMVETPGPTLDCPVCLAAGRPRPAERYFTDWPDACGVQIANFLYEAGIIVFAVVRALPRWANPPLLGNLGRLLLVNQRALASLGMSECPNCGRHTTGLYGEGSAGNPYRCRWCLDREPPIAFQVSLEPGVPTAGQMSPKSEGLKVILTLMPRSSPAEFPPGIVPASPPSKRRPTR